MDLLRDAKDALTQTQETMLQRSIRQCVGCRETFIKTYEDRHPEKLLKITEKFLGDCEGEEQKVIAAPEVIAERNLPMDDEMGADPDEAMSSGENVRLKWM